MKPELELYIHIPFCARKCNYCDFLSFRADADVQEAYTAQLINELTMTAAQCSGYRVSSVFVGGGTPSILPGDYIIGIMDAVRQSYDLSEDAEITIECNPGSVIRHKFAAYKEAGINRLSLGLQSADNAELRMLGRIHSFEDFLKSYQAARLEGFDNINVDLINCFPMQSTRTWRKTLKTVLMLKPEHVSVYNLIIEPGTPFYDMKESGMLMMPSEEEQEQIDRFTREFMGRNGYHRYEFGNWAKPGYESVHNSGYWTGVPYIGFGIGASSYFNGCRWKNVSDIAQYLSFDFVDNSYDSAARLHGDVHELSRNERMEEFVFLGLRRTEGISPTVFKGNFGMNIESVYEVQISRNTELGLMEEYEGRIRLTDRGIDVSNVVLSEFLLD